MGCKKLIEGVPCGESSVDEDGYCRAHDQAATSWEEIRAASTGLNPSWEQHVREGRTRELLERLEG